MDFKRVEGIFLVVFLFLNMFLFYVYQEGKNEQRVVTSGTISDNLEERLRGDDIDIPHDLSQKKLKGYYLSAEETDLLGAAKADLKNQEWQITDNRLLSHYPNEASFEINDPKEEKVVNRFVVKQSNVLYGKEYRLNPYETVPTQKYVYNQEWEGVPFFDSTSELILGIAKGQDNHPMIDSYEQSMLENVEPLREPQNLITEREAMISLYTNNRIPGGTDVAWIELGYTRIFKVKGKNVYIPAWFIGLDNGKGNIQVERINAFTSAIISSSNVSEVSK